MNDSIELLDIYYIVDTTDLKWIEIYKITRIVCDILFKNDNIFFIFYSII